MTSIASSKSIADAGEASRATGLCNEFGKTVFNNWLADLEFFDVQDEGRIRIAAPNKFIRDWVASHYGDRIRVVLSELLNTNINGIDFIVGKTGRIHRCVSIPTAIDEIGTPLNPDYTFEKFGEGFDDALAQRIADLDRTLPNPLFFDGDSKTMQAIAWYVKAHNKTVLYLSAEKFMYRFIQALRLKDTKNFRDSFKSVDVLMVDDFHLIEKKITTKKELFNTPRRGETNPALLVIRGFNRLVMDRFE